MFMAERRESVTRSSFPPLVQNFVVKADDLEQIAELGRGAYGVVDKMKHVPSGVIMAVKVGRRPCTRGGNTVAQWHDSNIETWMILLLSFLKPGKYLLILKFGAPTR